MKKCTKCKKIKQENEFHKSSSASSGLQWACKQCVKKYTLQKYRTHTGLIKYIYLHQKASSKERGHKPPSYSMEELKEWMLKQPKFYTLFKKWVSSNYNRWEIPSVDRINNNKGYAMSNIQLMNWRENCRNGHDDRMKGIIGCQTRKVNQLNLNGTFIKEHCSLSSAARDLNVSASNICRQIKGKHAHIGGYLWEYV